MSELHSLLPLVNSAISHARHMVELGCSLLNDPNSFPDEMRRLRRDLPFLLKKILSAFRGSEALADELRHALTCLEEDTCEIADWVMNSAEELRQLQHAAHNSTDRADASLRHGEAIASTHANYQRRRNVAMETCNRFYITANQICTAVDKEAARQSALSKEVLAAERREVEGTKPMATPKNKPLRGKGRPKGGGTPQTDLKLYQDWQAAKRTTGISKQEFVRERGLDPEEGFASLERGRKASPSNRRTSGK